MTKISLMFLFTLIFHILLRITIRGDVAIVRMRRNALVLLCWQNHYRLERDGHSDKMVE